MGQLIDDLLNFSRMGRHELIKTLINNNNLVAAIKHEIESHQTAGKNIAGLYMIYLIPLGI